MALAAGTAVAVEVPRRVVGTVAGGSPALTERATGVPRRRRTRRRPPFGLLRPRRRPPCTGRTLGCTNARLLTLHPQAPHCKRRAGRVSFLRLLLLLLLLVLLPALLLLFLFQLADPFRGPLPAGFPRRARGARSCSQLQLPRSLSPRSRAPTPPFPLGLSAATASARSRTLTPPWALLGEHAEHRRGSRRPTNP